MNLEAGHFSQQSIFENLSLMNRFTLLLFLCVFALSEVLLAAKKARIRGVAGVKNSNGVRLVRSNSCVTDRRCDRMCKSEGASGGARAGDDDNGLCDCDGQRGTETKETCVAGCNILGVGGGEFSDGWCACNVCNE